MLKQLLVLLALLLPYSTSHDKKYRKAVHTSTTYQNLSSLKNIHGSNFERKRNPDTFKQTNENLDTRKDKKNNTEKEVDQSDYAKRTSKVTDVRKLFGKGRSQASNISEGDNEIQLVPPPSFSTETPNSGTKRNIKPNASNDNFSFLENISDYRGITSNEISETITKLSKLLRNKKAQGKACNAIKETENELAELVEEINNLIDLCSSVPPPHENLMSILILLN